MIILKENDHGFTMKKNNWIYMPIFIDSGSKKIRTISKVRDAEYPLPMVKIFKKISLCRILKDKL